MKALVTGATGFLGTNVLVALLEEGWDVRGLGFSCRNDAYAKELGVPILRADIADPDDLDRVLAGSDTDVVFNVAGDTSFWNQRAARQRRTNVDGAIEVAKACQRHGVRRLVHTSTVDALGYNSTGVVDETWTDFTYRGMGYHYAETKREGELAVRAMNGPDLEVVVTQPGSMLGPYDFTLQFGRLFLDLRDGKVPGVPAGGCPFAHVEEVARSHVRAAQFGRPGESYILGGINVSYRTVFNQISAKVGANPPRITMPWSVMVGYGYVSEALSRFTGKAPEMNPGQARYMSSFPRYSSQKAESELGFKQRELTEQIDDAYDWYVANGFL